MRFRLGGVPFGVGAPLLAGLGDDPSVELVLEPPTRLIELLREGRLDAALVSSIEAFRTPGYRVAPSLSICCEGPARSVRAFVRRGAKIRTVALDAGSETSVALLKVLLAKVLHAEGCAFTKVAPTLEPDAFAEDLVLLIGDCGLQAQAGDREVWDLGHKWQQWTRLPFVFAVWLLRAGADAAAIVKTLTAARERGRQLGAVDGTHGAAHYDLDDEDVRGLRHFWAECRALGLASAGDPRFVPHSIPASR